MKISCDADTHGKWPGELCGADKGKERRRARAAGRRAKAGRIVMGLVTQILTVLKIRRVDPYCASSYYGHGVYLITLTIFCEHRNFAIFDQPNATRSNARNI